MPIIIDISTVQLHAVADLGFLIEREVPVPCTVS